MISKKPERARRTPRLGRRTLAKRIEKLTGVDYETVAAVLSGLSMVIDNDVMQQGKSLSIANVGSFHRNPFKPGVIKLKNRQEVAYEGGYTLGFRSHYRRRTK